MLYAYLRVSTDEQAKSGLGIAAQFEAVLRSAPELDPQNVYMEPGRSGSLAPEKRPILQNLLNDLQPGDVIIVPKRDRLSRDIYQALGIEAEIYTKGAKVLSACGEGDNETAAGRFFKNMMYAVAQFEFDRAKERMSDVHRTLRTHGRKASSVAPYGYRFEGKVLAAQEEEATILRDMTYLYETEGLAPGQIASRLNRAGHRNRSGGRWSGYVITKILNRHYARQGAAA